MLISIGTLVMVGLAATPNPQGLPPLRERCAVVAAILPALKGAAERPRIFVEEYNADTSQHPPFFGATETCKGEAFDLVAPSAYVGKPSFDGLHLVVQPVSGRWKFTGDWARIGGDAPGIIDDFTYANGQWNGEARRRGKRWHVSLTEEATCDGGAGCHGIGMRPNGTQPDGGSGYRKTTDAEAK